eukprot:7380482-Prymnesium_polylepis.1
MGQLCKVGWGNCGMRFRTDLYTTLYKSGCVMCNAHPKQWFDSPERAASLVDAVHRVAAHSTAHPHSGEARFRVGSGPPKTPRNYPRAALSHTQ